MFDRSYLPNDDRQHAGVELTDDWKVKTACGQTTDLAYRTPFQPEADDACEDCVLTLYQIPGMV